MPLMACECHAQVLAEVGAAVEATVLGAESLDRWVAAASMLEALEAAARALVTHANGGTVLCCGSVFVVADMRAALARQQPRLFRLDDWAFDEAGEPPLLM